MEEIVKKICLKEINKDEKRTGKIIVGQRNQNKKNFFFFIWYKNETKSLEY